MPKKQTEADYLMYRFSIRCKTTDLAVLHCLRALCQWAEHYSYPQIGWGGTTAKSWSESNGEFTVRFTSPDYRSAFVQKADELLQGRWQQVKTDDNDPATRQRQRH